MKLLNNCFVVILVYFFIEVGGFFSLKRLDIETLGNVDINTFRLWIKDISFIVLGNCIFVSAGKWIIWIEDKFKEFKRKKLLKKLDLEGELSEFD